MSQTKDPPARAAPSAREKWDEALGASCRKQAPKRLVLFEVHKSGKEKPRCKAGQVRRVCRPSPLMIGTRRDLGHDVEEHPTPVLVPALM
jgi:hypothetical protein